MTLPRLRKNIMNGESVLEVRCERGCRHSIDIETIIGLHEIVDAGRLIGCMVQTPVSLTLTRHTFDDVIELLYPEVE